MNFALNLEYLEAEFYLMATWGTTLVGAGILTESETAGASYGGNKVPGIASSPFAFAASGLRTDEVNHVKYLRKCLGIGCRQEAGHQSERAGLRFLQPIRLPETWPSV